MGIDHQYLGQRLKERGFRDWFLYLFNAIMGRKFELYPIHEDMFQITQGIIDGEYTRVCENMPPRTGKTTDAAWTVVYGLVTNPESQIIYTSFNQALLTEVSNLIANILQHPVFKELYPTFDRPQIIDSETPPLDEWWRLYALQTNGKATFSSRKITTASGGIILFNSIGSAITGFGAGIRNKPGFTGIVVIDDGDKPTDVRSQVMREKTHAYFAETLLSRLNNPWTPILNLQQRLHVDDLSGFLIENYNFKCFAFPLLDENENCALPNQYPPERIAELKVNNYVFQAQYQQNPIQLAGNLIKHEWWRYYTDYEDTKYIRLLITADLANKTKEWNDYTAIGVWGLTAQRKLRLLDLVHAKLEIQEVQKVILTVWENWKKGIGSAKLTKIIIEDKASGTQVIQQLSRNLGLPIIPFIPEKDKLTRTMDAIPQIVAGNIELPDNDRHPISATLLREADAFAADFSHKHDDLIDMTCMAIDDAFNQKGFF